MPEAENESLARRERTRSERGRGENLLGPGAGEERHLLVTEARNCTKGQGKGWEIRCRRLRMNHPANESGTKECKHGQGVIARSYKLLRFATEQVILRNT